LHAVRESHANVSDGSTRVVYAALGGNLAIAAAKFAAFAFSRSTSMLTEGIHSLVDSIDQGLLLFGQRRARKHRDRTHPLGYGMETYFWSFVVALVVFGMGGVASIYEGWARLRGGGGDLTSPWVNLAVLGFAALFEGYSFSVGFREYKHVVRDPGVSIWTFIKASKDPSLYATLLEDMAALTGIVFAALGVIGGAFFDLHWADGVASMAIGALLIAVSAVLANETRSLIAGEAVAPPVLEKLRRSLARETRIAEIHEIATLHLGPRVVMVALTLSFAAELRARELGDAIRSLTRLLKDTDDRIGYVFVRPPGTVPEDADGFSDRAAPAALPETHATARPR
jgi:cation diffusion facilitator family transporter